MLKKSDVLLLNIIMRRAYIKHGYEFSKALLNKLGIDLTKPVPSSLVLDLVHKTETFDNSYLLKSMLNEKSFVFLPTVLHALRQPKYQPLPLI